MGVMGLQSFVTENSSLLLENYVLKNSMVVIDGSSLCHQLVYRSKIEYKFGGDYPKLSEVIERFFSVLQSCSVTPTVYFDGPLDPKKRKFSTTINRQKFRLHSAKQIFQGREGRVLPLFTREVFVEVLSRLCISCHFCYGEADRTIASAANRASCPVISQDSDFCIFHLSGGYIPLESFEWENIARNGIPCRLFRSEKLLQQVGATKNHWTLPLFAVIAGNDFVSGVTFSRFIEHLPKPKTGKKLQFNRKHVHMISVLKWLSGKHSADEAVEGIAAFSKQKERQTLRENLLNWANMYVLDSDEDFSDEVPDLPDWCVAAVSSGRMPSYTLRIIVDGVNILSPLIENFAIDSVYDCCQEIREAVYRLLLPNGKVGVVEYSRKGSDILKRNIDIRHDSESRSTPNVSELKGDEKVLLFYEASGIGPNWLSQFSDESQVFAASVLYWIRKCRNTRMRSFIWALLSCRWYLTKQLTGVSEEEFFPKIRDSVSIPSTCNRRYGDQRKSSEFYRTFIHCFSQWQVIFYSLSWLNSVLNFPFPESHFSTSFSGKIVYNLSAGVFANKNPLESWKRILGERKEAVSDFLEFVKPFLVCINESLGDSNEDSNCSSGNQSFSCETVDDQLKHLDFFDKENRFSLLRN